MSRTVPARMAERLPRPLRSEPQQRLQPRRPSPRPGSAHCFRIHSPSRRAWLLAFAAFDLLAAAWSLAMPADGTTDERQHLERAYGAVTGHLLGPQGVDPLVHRPGAAFDVPKSLLPPNALCVYFPNYHQDRSWVASPAGCQEPAPPTHAKVRVVSWVGRYNPLFYLAVGAPLRFWPDLTGIVLSRLLAATLSAAFAATAAAIAIRSRRPLLLAALLTVMTPTTIALSSTVNPNGVEITAALLLWVCLVDLARPQQLRTRLSESRLSENQSPSRNQGPNQDQGLSGGRSRSWGLSRNQGPNLDQSPSQGRGRSWGLSRNQGQSQDRSQDRNQGQNPASRLLSEPVLLGLAAVAGAVVLTVRAMGPFWFALAVGGAAAVAERGRVRALAGWRAARVVGFGWAVIGLLAVGWNVVSGNNKVTHTLIAVHPADHRVLTLLRVIAVEHVGGWFTEAFALDVQAPWVPMLWAALSAVVLVPLALTRTRRVVLVALAVAAVSLGVTVVLEIEFLGTLGWSQYGRYFLPGLAGVAVLLSAGPVLELPPSLQRRIPRLVAVGAAGAQLWVLAVEMTRVQSGPAAPLNPLAGSWHPGVGSLAVLVVAALGAAALIAVVWTATATAPYHAATRQVLSEAANS